MKKVDFIEGIKEILELGDLDINENTHLNITSLGTLSIIVFIDESLNKQCKASDLRSVNTINDLIILIGENYFD